MYREGCQCSVYTDKSLIDPGNVGDICMHSSKMVAELINQGPDIRILAIEYRVEVKAGGHKADALWIIQDLV